MVILNKIILRSRNFVEKFVEKIKTHSLGLIPFSSEIVLFMR